MNEKTDAVFALPPLERYRHFIKAVVEGRKMWGLYGDGWAMSETPDGHQVLPLWPGREFAELCVADEWSDYQPREIDLEAALGMMIPTLRREGVLPGVFFSNEHGAIIATLDELERDLRAELGRVA